MKKRLILIITCFCALWLNACSLTDWRLLHRIDIQQGNVLTQEALDQLKPGMTRRQVQFVLGSPMVADVFHQDRWDYIYRLETGTGKISMEQVTVFFEADRLTHISGTMHPQESADSSAPATEQVTLVVPPEERVPPGLLNRFWHWMTFREIENDTVN